MNEDHGLTTRMTEGEALRILAAIQDLWDYREIGPDAERIWVANLTEVPLPDGLEALRTLSRTSTFRPSPAEFHEACRQIRRRRREEAEQQARSAALPPPTEMPEHVRETVAALRGRTVAES